MESNTVKWYVEKGVFEENEKALEAVLGDRLTYVKYNPVFNKDDRDIVDMDDNTVSPPGIFYGSIQLARMLQNRGFFSFLPDKAFDCTQWMPFFGTLSLNDDHFYVEAGRFRSLVNSLKLDSVPFFVKQEKGYKFLSGHVYDSAMTCDEIERSLYPHELMLISPIQSIGREFRFVVAEKIDGPIIVTYSAYSHSGEDKEPVPESAVKFVTDCLNSVNYYPSQVWTLDICELGHVGSNQYRVVEPNGLLCAGWYNCDVEKIVESVDSFVPKVKV